MQSFSSRVLAWFEIHGRKHLPWQQESTPYKVWISEIMLQQTQVVTVIPYFNRFIERFPDVVSLANAEQDEVLSHWAGLGYYSRARNLHQSAIIIRDKHQGVFPQSLTELMALPGIGQSTASAILSLSFGFCYPILDGNVKRVLSRHQCIDGIPNRADTLKKQWAVAEQFMPTCDCDKYTQAMMDLGALICTRTQPRCDVCPVHLDCGAFQTNSIADYPNKKLKKALPEKHAIFLVITDGEHFALEKRPDSGIWGGLWSCYEIADDSRSDTAITALLHEKHYKEIKRTPLPEVIHQFTHYRLLMRPIVIEVEAIADGVRIDALETLGLPAPISKILSGLIRD